MIHNHYWLWKETIAPSVCDAILAECDWEKASAARHKVGSEFKQNSEYRDTDVIWHNQVSIASSILYRHIEAANEVAGWNFKLDFPEPTQIARYQVGGHYREHMDTFAPDQNNKQRKLTGVLLLSDPSEYEGGELALTDSKDLEFAGKGSIIVFPSFLKHSVSPVISGTRYSAACWAVGPAFR